MGSSDSNPFSAESGDLSQYNVEKVLPDQNLTYLTRRVDGKQYLLREMTFNEQRSYESLAENLTKRDDLNCEHLTSLTKTSRKAQDHLCSDFYKIWALWEYPSKSLERQISLRKKQGYPFTEQELWSILSCSIIGMSELQNAGIKHDSLTTNTLLLDQRNLVKVADPLAISCQTNYDAVYSKKAAPNVYISPEQCDSLNTQRPISNSNPYKQDVYTMGMIMMESALLEEQQKCYLDDYSEVDDQKVQYNLNRVSDKYSHDFRLLLQAMLHPDSRQRLDWIDLKSAVSGFKAEGKSRITNRQPNQSDNVMYNNTNTYNNADSQFSTKQYINSPISYTPQPSSYHMQSQPASIQQSNDAAVLRSLNSNPSIPSQPYIYQEMTPPSYVQSKIYQDRNQFNVKKEARISQTNLQPARISSIHRQSQLQNNKSPIKIQQHFNQLTNAQSPAKLKSNLPNFQGPYIQQNIPVNYNSNTFNYNNAPINYNSSLAQNSLPPISHTVQTTFNPQTINMNKNQFQSSIMQQGEFSSNNQNYKPTTLQSHNHPKVSINYSQSPKIPSQQYNGNQNYSPAKINYVPQTPPLAFYPPKQFNSQNKAPQQETIYVRNSSQQNFQQSQPPKQNYFPPQNIPRVSNPIPQVSPRNMSINNPPSNMTYYHQSNSPRFIHETISNVPLIDSTRKLPLSFKPIQSPNQNQINHIYHNNNLVKNDGALYSNATFKQQLNSNQVRNLIDVNVSDKFAHITQNRTVNNEKYSNEERKNSRQYEREFESQDNESERKKMRLNQHQDLQLEFVIEHFEQGSRYEGNKLNGMREGQGKFFYQDGGEYVGNWHQNKMQGYGCLYYQSEKLAYEGQWLNDQFHGKGKLYNQLPQKLQGSFDYENFDEVGDYWHHYEGYFVEDSKQGEGKLVLSNGEYYAGNFNADTVHGLGAFTTLDGHSIKGIWENNQFLQEIK